MLSVFHYSKRKHFYATTMYKLGLERLIFKLNLCKNI